MAGIGGIGSGAGAQPMSLVEDETAADEDDALTVEQSALIDKMIGEIIVGPAIMRMTQEMQDVIEEHLNTKEYIG